uniref:Uncharacterized protein n=1 Tax=Lygus hesperus TaxID=30085 RepID=A0A146LTW3_LYGHE
MEQLLLLRPAVVDIAKRARELARKLFESYSACTTVLTNLHDDIVMQQYVCLSQHFQRCVRQAWTSLDVLVSRDYPTYTHHAVSYIAHILTQRLFAHQPTSTSPTSSASVSDSLLYYFTANSSSNCVRQLHDVYYGSLLPA